MDPVRTLVTAAAASYTANCALGGSVALGLLDTRAVDRRTDAYAGRDTRRPADPTDPADTFADSHPVGDPDPVGVIQHGQWERQRQWQQPHADHPAAAGARAIACSRNSLSACRTPHRHPLTSRGRVAPWGGMPSARPGGSTVVSSGPGRSWSRPWPASWSPC